MAGFFFGAIHGRSTIARPGLPSIPAFRDEACVTSGARRPGVTHLTLSSTIALIRLIAQDSGWGMGCKPRTGAVT